MYYVRNNWPRLISSHAVSQGNESASTTRIYSVYKKESVVRGHHIYKKSWTAVIGEVLPVEREDNQHDDHAVDLMKNGGNIGHMPCSMPCTLMTRP